MVEKKVSRRSMRSGVREVVAGSVTAILLKAFFFLVDCFLMVRINVFG